MASPKSRFGLNRTSNETKSPQSFAKVYMRNVGKGQLEFSDGTLKFYVEKGRFSKSKELSKEINVKNVESVSLEGKELIVAQTDNVNRFVFEDMSLAQQVFAEAEGLIRQPEEQPTQVIAEKEEAVIEPKPEEAELKEILGGERVTEPEIQSEQTKKEQSQVRFEELSSKQVSCEVQKQEECLPAELTKQVAQKNIEIPFVQEQNELKDDVHVETPKEPQDSIYTSEAMPEVQQEPLVTSEIDITKEAEKAPAAIEFLKKELSPREKELSNERRAQSEFSEQEVIAQTLSTSMLIVDSLFDVLRSLQGRIKWKFIDQCEKLSEKANETLAAKKMGLVNLDFRIFSSAIAEHDVEAVSKEAFVLLDSLKKVFEKLSDNEASVSSASQNYSSAKIELQSYYILSDLILAAIVEDEDVEEETGHLVTLLNNLSSTRKQAINLDEILSLINKVEARHGDEADIAEVRRAFRNQLNLPAQVD